jgi:eukaryotic-like serine/threonine-protein kinase
MRRLLGERYQIMHPVWRDRLGKTYVARDRMTGGPVAVRVLPAELATDEVADRFHAQRRRLTGIHHPHLAGVLDLVVDRDTGRHLLAIVSEAVAGPTLRQRLRASKTPPPAQIARIGAAVAAGLRVLHDAGLVHRNLSQDTVVVPPDGRVRLADIAVAHLLAGTGIPAAPADDVFALGVLLHDLTPRRWGASSHRLSRRFRARDPRTRPTAHQAMTLLLAARSGPARCPVSA